MPRNQDDLFLFASLLLFSKISQEASEGEPEPVALRNYIARSAMHITHPQRLHAEQMVTDLLQRYESVLGDRYGDDDAYDWGRRERIVYDERVADVWRDGVRQRTSIQVTYRSEKPEVTKRLVDPWETRAPYGVGYCHLRRASRTFRFDRVVKAEPTHKLFRKPKNWKELTSIGIISSDE